jgi:DNA-binding transcriptional MerR regulator
MFCIAAFIILAVLGIFSARYRKLAGNAWKCVGKKATFRKCDTSFKEDTKSMLLGKLVLRRPRLTKFLEKWIDVLAFIFVVLTIWSLFVVVKSGMNLYVYGTCNPNNSESCSIGAEACGITTETVGFWDSITSLTPHKWAANEAGQFAESVSRIPDRMKNWQAEDYINATNSYYNPQDTSKPYALEIIDPGCIFCANLFKNLKEAGVEQRYNLTYMVYPIPDTNTKSGYKFDHSYHIGTYLEAIKLNPIEVTPAADWQILERIFTWENDKGFPYQTYINSIYTEKQVDELMESWLKDIGYSEDQIVQIAKTAESTEVKERLAEHKRIVDQQIKTVKIPTLIIDGKRYNGVVSSDRLR